MGKERWSIYIDMEGFSALYDKENQILWSLGEMMLAIHRIGTRVYPSVPDRLFVHQTGDGFVIQSDFHESSPLRAISIAVVILRHVASTGRFARAAISEGDMADIVGCYPKEVRDSQTDDRVVSLGAGLMTLFPIMGMGLIRAFGVSKLGPPGPLLLLDPLFRTRVPLEVPTKDTHTNNTAPLSVDWIHTNLALATSIQSQAGLAATPPVEIEKKLIEYCETFKVDKWASGVTQFLQTKC